LSLWLIDWQLPMIDTLPPATNTHPPAALQQPAGPQQLVQTLGQQIRDLEKGRRREGPIISSGSSAIDRCLPQGGFLAGSMVEFTTPPGLAVGATTLALCMARQAAATGKYIVLFDTLKQYFPPALERLKLPLERVIGIRPTNHSDFLWAMDQALRCSAVGCVVAQIDRFDDRTARRFQLATEIGGGLGFLIRSASTARSQPSWADVQWHITSPSAIEEPSMTTRWFHATLKRCHGGKPGARLRLGVDAAGQWIESKRIEGYDAKASHVYLAAELAKPARIRREAAG
jgi:protein ImuA